MLGYDSLELPRKTVRSVIRSEVRRFQPLTAALRSAFVSYSFYFLRFSLCTTRSARRFQPRSTYIRMHLRPCPGPVWVCIHPRIRGVTNDPPVFTNYIAAAAQEHSKSKTHQSVGVVEVERALKSVGFEQLMPESYKCIGSEHRSQRCHRPPVPQLGSLRRSTNSLICRSYEGRKDEAQEPSGCVFRRRGRTPGR